MIHRFGPFEADEERFELRRRRRVIPVQRRVLDTILFLARSGGRLVTRDDLIQGPWQGIVVSDAAFSQAIMLARRAITDSGRGVGFILTVRGKGWRWAGGNGAPDAPPAMADRHDPPDGTAPWRPIEARSDSGGLTLPPRRSSVPQTHIVEALELGERTIALATRRDDREGLLGAKLARAHHLFEMGRTADFERQADEHAALARRARHPGHLWFARIVEAARRYQDAQIGHAENMVWRSLGEGLSAIGPAAEGIAAAHLLNLALEIHGPARRKTLARVRVLADRCTKREPHLFSWKALLAVTRLQLGDRMGARRLYDRLSKQLARLADDRHLLPTLVNLVDLAIAFRDWKHLRLVADRFSLHEGLRVCRDFADWGPVSFHLGRAARELGEAGASRRFFERALAHSAAAGARCWQHWAGYAFARALADTGRAADARRSRDLMHATSAAARALRMPALIRATSRTDAPSPTSLLQTAA